MWKFNQLWYCQKLLKTRSSILNRELFSRSRKKVLIIRNNSTLPDASKGSRLQDIPTRQQRAGGGNLTPYNCFLLVIPIGCFSLGCWQVKRKKWKEELIEKVEYKTTLVPVSLPEDLTDLTDYEYRPVRVKGTFDHSREIFLGPRSLLLNGENVSQTALFSSQDSNKAGYLVITPFKLSDRKETILVNRGWVPSNKRDPRTRFAGQVEGEVEIEGVVRLSENRAPFMKENRNPHLWSYRDVYKMARELGTYPVFIDAKLESSVPGGPIGGQTKISFWNEHMSYIVTWYGLSLGTGYMWYKNYIRK